MLALISMVGNCPEGVHSSPKEQLQYRYVNHLDKDIDHNGLTQTHLCGWRACQCSNTGGVVDLAGAVGTELP